MTFTPILNHSVLPTYVIRFEQPYLVLMALRGKVAYYISDQQNAPGAR